MEGLKKKKIRRVFLDDLPRWREGQYKDKINWKESIGYKVKFVYEDIEGEVEIIEYNYPKLNIRYKENIILTIGTSHFQKCQIGRLLGKVTNEFKIEIGQILKDDKKYLVIIDREYRNRIDNKENYKYYKYKCNKCNNIDMISEGNLLSGKGCNVCGGRKVLKGFNDVATTHNYLIKFLDDKEDSYRHTFNSTKPIKVKCPYCGAIYKSKMRNIYIYSKVTCNCNDGISYPEKFMFALLEQLNLEFKTELNKTTFKWCDKYRYDFYIPSINGILETHGIQHYEENKNWELLLEEIEENDKRKKQLALQNGIKEENYIVIDCRKSELEWIKNNILNSKLSGLFDLSSVDWLKCHEYSLSSLIKKVCEIKANNPAMSTTDIGNILGFSSSTILNYLKKGTKIWDWVNYDVKEEATRNKSKGGKKRSKQVEIFKDDISLGVFESATELVRRSRDLFGIILKNQGISKSCIENKQYKGYVFNFIS